MVTYPKFLIAELNKVDALIKQSITSKIDKVNLISDYIINSGGKRIRPVLAILSAHLCGDKSDKSLYLASAVEFIHTATLLHDDVIDDSELRRGKQVANLKWGNQLAILVGDFLFTQAFKQMVTINSIEVLASLSQASSVIAEGEVDQLENIMNINLSYEQYVKIISAKTAELFAAACECGAIIAGQPKNVQKSMFEFGKNIGIAFQIVDDVIDYSPAKLIGKDSGNDFKEGKVTLPVISVIDSLSKKEFELFKQIFQKKDHSVASLSDIRKIIEYHGGFEKSRKFAHDYVDQAMKILSNFASSTPKDCLVEIISEQTSRLN